MFRPTETIMTCALSLSTACAGATMDPAPGGGPDLGDNGDTWADTDTPSTSTSTSSTTGGDDSFTSGAEGSDEAGSGGESFVEVVFFGEAAVVPGTSLQGEAAAVVVEYLPDETENVYCMVEWTVTSSTAAADCTDCEMAFEVEYGAAHVETDVDGACAAHGIVPEEIEGTQLGLGYRGSEVLLREDGTWTAIGWAELDAASSVLIYEWVVE
jgi:hypothetical protein